MTNLIAFVKKHWTWISGLVTAIVVYVSPALKLALTSAESKHPEYETFIATALLLLAHFSPSPTSKS